MSKDMAKLSEPTAPRSPTKRTTPQAHFNDTSIPFESRRALRHSHHPSNLQATVEEGDGTNDVSVPCHSTP